MVLSKQWLGVDNDSSAIVVALSALDDGVRRPLGCRREIVAMGTESNCILPEDIYYWIEKHVWAKPYGDLIEVGITDPAQGLAGKMLVCRIKRVGRELKHGASAATLESGKWVGGVSTPVAGVIAEVNTKAEEDPEVLNRDPYGTWLMRITPAHWDEDVQTLVTGQDGVRQYQAKISQDGIQCGH
jgi:glycine cleavage system H protein